MVCPVVQTGRGIQGHVGQQHPLGCEAGNALGLQIVRSQVSVRGGACAGKSSDGHGHVGSRCICCCQHPIRGSCSHKLPITAVPWTVKAPPDTQDGPSAESLPLFSGQLACCSVEQHVCDVARGIQGGKCCLCARGLDFTAHPHCGAA